MDKLLLIDRDWVLGVKCLKTLQMGGRFQSAGVEPASERNTTSRGISKIFISYIIYHLLMILTISDKSLGCAWNKPIRNRII